MDVGEYLSFYFIFIILVPLPFAPEFTSSAGNLVTLNEIPKNMGIDIRAELLKFHAEKYSSNIMKVVVFGKGESALFCVSVSVVVVLFFSAPNDMQRIWIRCRSG